MNPVGLGAGGYPWVLRGDERGCRAGSNRAREHAYLSALRTLPEVEVQFGTFLAKNMWRPLTNLPAADRRLHAPQPATLPAGHHPVAGANPRTHPCL